MSVNVNPVVSPATVCGQRGRLASGLPAPDFAACDGGGVSQSLGLFRRQDVPVPVCPILTLVPYCPLYFVASAPGRFIVQVETVGDAL